VPVHMIGASHSPLIELFTDAPLRTELLDAFHARAETLAEFDPDVMIVLGSDHYTGFHYRMLPSFCIGLAATAVDDAGGTPGRLQVPVDLAADLARHIRDHDIDIAVSHDMVVDHGFSQVAARLTGAIDAVATIPIFISSNTEPRPSPRRARALGTAIGRWARARDLRVAVVASGGLSHDPSIAFPPLEEATPDIAPYLVSGGSVGPGVSGVAMTREEWLGRVRLLTEMAHDLLRTGAIAHHDVRLNPDWDRAFLDAITLHDPYRFDSWTTQEMIDAGGPGAAECLHWIAAAAAAFEAGSPAPVVDLCMPAPQFIIGVGLAHTPLAPDADRHRPRKA
jgi:2,3-dihydroxyphenylpropionate 1,2-dioxygenase